MVHVSRKGGWRMRWGRSLGARRNSGPLCAYSQASWESLKEDARLARETWPPSRRAGSVRLGAGVGEEPPAGWTEPGAPSRRASGVAPGPAVCFPDAHFLCARRTRDEEPRRLRARLACTGRPAEGPCRSPSAFSLFPPSHPCTAR